MCETHADCHQTTLTGVGTTEPFIYGQSGNVVAEYKWSNNAGRPLNYNNTQNKVVSDKLPQMRGSTAKMII